MLRLNNIVKRVWRRLLERGAVMQVGWVPGEHMVATGIDALSRLKWAKACDWTLKPRVCHELRRWVREWGEPQCVWTRDVISGAAMAARYDGVVTVCFPGGAHIERWVAFLRQMRLKACVILPRWHGPAMAAVARGRLAEKHLGPARAIFDSPRAQAVPAWKMVATVADFGSDAEVQV